MGGFRARAVRARHPGGILADKWQVWCCWRGMSEPLLAVGPQNPPWAAHWVFCTCQQGLEQAAEGHVPLWLRGCGAAPMTVPMLYLGEK